MRRVVAGAVLLVAAGVTLAQAQDYPTKVVRVIVPTTAGGVGDVLARVIGQSLSRDWGQSIIVENRPGADEMIGTAAVAKAPADGYTLLVTGSSPIIAAPHLHAVMQYDPQKDLTPILILGQITPVMNVPASLPVKNVQEYIALARSKPGELNYGSFGNGTYVHLAMEDFKQRTGTQIQHVPYRGSTPGVTALLQGEISALIVNFGNVAEHAKAGTVRIIAAAGAKRATMLPDLPTVAESGVPGFATGSWWGMFGPANLPKPIVDKIRADVSRALAAPEARKVFETNTLESVEKTPAEFEQFIRENADLWGRQIRAAGIKLE